MGTKAVFAIASETPGRHYATILGCTSDGFKDNLRYLAHLVAETARGLQVVTQFSKNRWNSGADQVIDAIAAHGGSHWFKDLDNNASWVSYSAIYNPKLNRLYLYEGHFECSLGYETVELRKAKTQDEFGKQIAKAYRKATNQKYEQQARQNVEIKKRETLREQGLAKLTLEERQALGVG